LQIRELKPAATDPELVSRFLHLVPCPGASAVPEHLVGCAEC
jgi:hypothetical protein